MTTTTKKAPEFSVPLASGGNFELYQVLKRGPVILNFITGTWCPLCQKHMGNLQKWQTQLQSSRKTITILVISAQDMPVIREWLNTNPLPFLFGSDTTAGIAKAFGINLAIVGTIQPATFLVDMDGTIRLSHTGVGDQTFHKTLENNF